VAHGFGFRSCPVGSRYTGIMILLLLILFANALKVKVKVKFTLEQATKAQRESRGIALLYP